MEHQAFETRLLSSLSKVFPDEELADQPYHTASALLNETFSFQVAYRSQTLLKPIKLRVESGLEDVVSLFTVGLVPSELPVYHDHDEHILRATPGLYPDPLYPLNLNEDSLTGYPGQWRSVWVTVEPAGKIEPGRYPVSIQFETTAGEVLGHEQFELEIIAASLPPQRLVHTEWFHTDCLATQYGTEVFSETHWTLIEQYVANAVKHGVNMILTPIFTPPLDTAVGGERPTVQLIEVEKTGDGYRFGFDRLARWVEMCNRQGVEYFEFSHLFTQWGAKHAPKIVATVDGEVQKIFGWETDAMGEAYKTFLRQCLSELTGWIQAHGLERRSYFHISDEPHLDHMEAYSSASETVKDLLADYPIIDALSNIEFYEQGLVRNPIPANDHIEPFLARQVEPLWTYYCCGQYRNVSNRSFSMPAARNRILGIQLYKFDVAGFLHWGYNFWYSQYSLKRLNPFQNTDAGGAFMSGDPFLVYPGNDGPINSMRMKVFHDALQDLRALRLLEERYGREQVLAEMEQALDEPITFSHYPRDAAWLLKTREWVNRKIKESL